MLKLSLPRRARSERAATTTTTHPRTRPSASGRRRKRRRRRRQRRARRVRRRTRRRRSARPRRPTLIETVTFATELGDLQVTPTDSCQLRWCCTVHDKHCVQVQLAVLLFDWILLCTVPSGEQRVLGVMGQAWWSSGVLKNFFAGVALQMLDRDSVHFLPIFNVDSRTRSCYLYHSKKLIPL
jgi:hypothetical protein